MEKQIDLAKLVNEIEDYAYEFTFVVFDNNKSVGFIEPDLDSIKEALKDFDKIFLQIGYFEYDEEFLDEPCFIFDEEDTVDDLEDDEYYEKYKSENAGYGIYLDKDLNVEYGYFITETFHDFKDARDDDEVKNEICFLLDEADIWKGADAPVVNSIDDFHNKIDLEKVVKRMDYNSIAFDNGKPVEAINDDLNSVKEALNNHDKIFLDLGFFGYEDEFGPCFIFNGDDIIDWEDNGDEYYDKYKFSVAGYGIFLDKDLNVEYGYYTTEAPPSGHGAGDTTIHDFKDAIDGDKIKEKIYSLLDAANIWESDNLEDNPIEEEELKKDIFIDGSCPKCGHNVNKNTENQVAIKCSECGHTFWF